MKRISITESQERILLEAYREGFSLKELSSLSRSPKAQYEYCVKWLGEPDGYGSSRCVFTLSDNLVLKLAFGELRSGGISQNKLEYEICTSYDSPLLPRVYNADKKFTYLVCENIIPCTEEDFEKILGIPFYHTYYQNTIKATDFDSKHNGDVEVGYNKYFDNIKKHNEDSEISLSDILEYIYANYVIDEPCYDSTCEKIINDSSWLCALANFVDDTGISDFCDVENFGMVNRDGNPSIVLLDVGMDMNVWEKHYKQ